MRPNVDTKSMAAQIPLFVDIDKEIEKFTNLVEEKNIAPKSLADLERIEKFFNNTLKELKTLIKNSSYSDNDKLFLLSKLTIDMYGKISEDYNLDFMRVAEFMGPWNVENFNTASENLSKLMP